MDNILKYKKQIIVSLVLTLVIVLLSLSLVLVAADDFKAKHFSIAFLLLIFVEVPVIISIAFSGIKAINIILEETANKKTLNNNVEENLQSDEVKINETKSLSLDYEAIAERIGKCDNLESFGQKMLIGIGKEIDVVSGVFYKYSSDKDVFEPISNYAYYSDTPPSSFSIGEGLNGQVVKDKKSMYIKDIPEHYVKIVSGLGSSQPKNILILPIKYESNIIGVVEFATFKDIETGILEQMDEVSDFIGSLMNKIG